ncbi:phosphate ABC transporter permease PstA [Halobium salinum]|uniref:Phosphate transport system permease protein PstA n=1 Tax=Halobium salinum TaxID=1364940 RepID=A0ABD5PCY2_9EURY|nr:phosphate ABC transporter permease PstA [Halobium salinum]
MSNRNATRSELVESDTSTYEVIAAATAAVGVLTSTLSFLTLAEIVPFEGGLGGIAMPTVFGAILSLLGVVTIGIGVVSAVGVVETTPDRDAGLVTAGAFGLLWAVVAGLVVSQSLGFGVVVWLPATLAVGVAVLFGAVFPKEDLGSTLPGGALALFAGAVFLTGTVGTGWSWSPPDLQASFTAPVVVPVVGIVGSLVTAWGAAKAHGAFGRRGRQRAAYMAIWLLAALVLTVLLYLLAFVTMKGAGRAFAGIGFGPGLSFNWPFLTNGVSLMEQSPGIWPAVVGTVWLVVGAVMMAVPLGIGAAVFLTEYAEQGRFTQVVEVATNGLWSTPSIVFGLFGYAFLVPRFGNTKSLFAGMLVLSFMLLPLVLITSRESLKSVPDEYRDASAALGVSRWETVRSVVLPAAMPGVVTGVILGVGRIAGETAPLLLVTAGEIFPAKQNAPAVLRSFQVDVVMGPPFLDVSNPALFEASSALPYQLYAIITAGLSSSNIENSLEFAWATAFVLLLVVLSFYAIGIATRTYFRRKISHE